MKLCQILFVSSLFMKNQTSCKFFIFIRSWKPQVDNFLWLVTYGLNLTESGGDELLSLLALLPRTYFSSIVRLIKTWTNSFSNKLACFHMKIGFLAVRFTFFMFEGFDSWQYDWVNRFFQFCLPLSLIFIGHLSYNVFRSASYVFGLKLLWMFFKVFLDYLLLKFPVLDSIGKYPLQIIFCHYWGTFCDPKFFQACLFPNSTSGFL